jgi:hypothetical protein
MPPNPQTAALRDKIFAVGKAVDVQGVAGLLGTVDSADHAPSKQHHGTAIRTFRQRRSDCEFGTVSKSGLRNNVNRARLLNNRVISELKGL